MTKVLLGAMMGLLCLNASAQLAFTNGSTLFNDATVSSGVALGIADMNGDGLDDLVRLNNASDLIIEYQQAGGGQFSKFVYGNTAPGREWGMAVADVNEDGYNDVLVGGVYNRLKVYLGGDDTIQASFLMPFPEIFLQAANFADINNDGLIDLFACHDDGIASVYRNDGNNSFVYDLSLINTASPNPSDNSGNYGSVWTDYDMDGDLDLYISKCRGGVSDPTDGRRANLLFENDGSNNYSEVSVAVGLQPGAQSWATDFADIDNDGDLDAFIINHDSISQLYENVNDSFINITAVSGIYTELDDYSNGIQSIFDDFDNDTYVDLIVTGINSHYVFRNNGDKTFTTVAALPAGTPDIHSLSVGDLNNDGFLDVLAGFANGFNTPSSTDDRLFLNSGNSNNWIKAQLKGSTSNINGIGARLELYGSWGRQTREIRGGEGYGIFTSLETHFGVGADSTIDSLVVLWPSGIRDVVCNPAHNTTITIREGCRETCEGLTSSIEEDICAGDGFSVTVNGTVYDENNPTGVEIFPAGAQQACDSAVFIVLTVVDVDESVTQNDNILTAAPGLTYQWIDCGNGNIPVADANDQVFTAIDDGSYAVIVSDENCTDTSDCFNVVTTAVFDDVFPFTLEIYPNPSSGILNVSFGRVVEHVNISIQSVHGASVYEGTIINSQRSTLDISEFPAGNYFLEIRYEDHIGVMQILKQ